MNYNFKDVEKKWKQKWQKEPYFTTKSDKSLPKYYCLDMFPYPSATGLHVGHWRGYVLSDVYARVKALQGFNILHPMGWDAFGLPAENAAIKEKINPEISTARNIATFKAQLSDIGAIYDWTKELSTTDPEYYKWTQWIFLQMFKDGLAYQAEMPINWCTSCLTGLANEEVVQGLCERCNSTVIQKNIRQWVLKITRYAEELLNGLEQLNWPEKVKLMQANWIGKSTGLIFNSPVKNSNLILETFSAHFEACYADTFILISSDHPLLPKLVATSPNKNKILETATKITAKRLEKKYAIEEYEGIFTEQYTIDPLGNGELPIWIANFVLTDYGTGIVKASAHDTRDFAFAKKYSIPLKVVLVPKDEKLKIEVLNQNICFTDMKNGILLEPSCFAGKISGAVREEIANYLVEKNLAKKQINYKLRDWIFSRQRYWGEPIPLIHCSNCGVVPVPEADLPVKLPQVENYIPTGTGESPLAAIKEWVNTICPNCKSEAKRETNTMPQWAGSCWYFLRYLNPKLKDKIFDAEELKYWLPVDLYVGGVEHAILHLLYSRFYIKFLHEKKYINFDEPFKQLFNQGMVCKYSEKTGAIEKMSKSKGNVVNPDDIVKQYGSDVLRIYMLFIGPPELDCVWQDSGLEGVKRFINKFINYFNSPLVIIKNSELESIESKKECAILINKIEIRLEQFKTNTIVSAFMEFLNNVVKDNLKFTTESYKNILTVFSIIAPFAASELLEKILNISLEHCSWPKFDSKLCETTLINYALQVNGKLRSTLSCKTNCSQIELENLAKIQIQKWLENKSIVKIIFVKNKIINFIIK